MPKVQFSLIEQFSDARSNELAYRFVIENQGTIALELTSITPRIPEDAEIIEGKDPSVVAAKLRYNELCSDLTEILHSFILSAIDEFKENYYKKQKDMFTEFITEAFKSFSPIRLYLNILKGTFIDQMKKKKRDEYKKL